MRLVAFASNTEVWPATMSKYGNAEANRLIALSKAQKREFVADANELRKATGGKKIRIR